MTKKNEFDWQEGAKLDEGNFSPLGDIRAYGHSKVHNAPASDAEKRIEERTQKLLGKASQPYRATSSDKPVSTDPNLISESTDEISGVYTDADQLKHLTGQGKSRPAGSGLFGKK